MNLSVFNIKEIERFLSKGLFEKSSINEIVNFVICPIFKRRLVIPVVTLPIIDFVSFSALIYVTFGIRTIPVRISRRTVYDTNRLKNFLHHDQSVLIHFQNAFPKQKQLHVVATENDVTHKINCRYEFSIQIKKYNDKIKLLRKDCHNQKFSSKSNRIDIMNESDKNRLFNAQKIFKILDFVFDLIDLIGDIMNLCCSSSHLVIKYQEIMMIIFIGSIFKFIFK